MNYQLKAIMMGVLLLWSMLGVSSIAQAGASWASVKLPFGIELGKTTPEGMKAFFIESSDNYLYTQFAVPDGQFESYQRQNVYVQTKRGVVLSVVFWKKYPRAVRSVLPRGTKQARAKEVLQQQGGKQVSFKKHDALCAIFGSYEYCFWIKNGKTSHLEILEYIDY